jgi:P27 family predicted phage terminase small subunit
MGLRGPNPRPMSVRSQRGHYGATLADVPASDLGPVGRCPAWLGGEARRFWKATAPALQALGLLTALDRACFTILCLSWADLRAAVELLAKEGVVSKSPRGVERPHPALKLQTAAAATFLNAAKAFGMTPAARQRVKVAAAGGKPDAFDELLDKAGKYFND